MIIEISFGERENEAPVIGVFKGKEQVFVYYYPELECSVREVLRDRGLRDWEIEKVVKAIREFSEFLDDYEDIWELEYVE